MNYESAKFGSAVGSFSESAVSGMYDFTRCQRPDGSFYGTSGKCKKGTQSAAASESTEEKQLMKKAAELYGKEMKARQLQDDVAAKKYMREHIAVVNKLNEIAEKKKTTANTQKIVLQRLYDRMDDAVTIREQQRISQAISDLQKKMRGAG